MIHSGCVIWILFLIKGAIVFIQGHSTEYDHQKPKWRNSYTEAHLQSRKIAAGFCKLGVKKGDVIMILLQKSAEFVLSFFAASMIGAVATTANPFYTADEIFNQFHAAKAKLFITQSAYVRKLQDHEDDKDIGEDQLKVITVDDPQEKCLHFSVVSEADKGFRV